MTDKIDVNEYDVVTMTSIVFHMNPLNWLKAVGFALYEVFRLPSVILNLLLVTIKVNAATFNSNLRFDVKFTASLFSILTVLFWFIPKKILYAVVKLALVCILLEFKINRIIVPLASEAKRLHETLSPDEFEKVVLASLKETAEKSVSKLEDSDLDKGE